jgi:hypothetical protein
MRKRRPSFKRESLKQKTSIPTKRRNEGIQQLPAKQMPALASSFSLSEKRIAGANHRAIQTSAIKPVS